VAADFSWGYGRRVQKICGDKSAQNEKVEALKKEGGQ